MVGLWWWWCGGGGGDGGGRAAADLATSHRHRSSFLQRLGRFLLLAGQAGLLPPAARPEDREAPPPPRRTQRWRRQHTHHRVGAPLCLTEALLDVVEGAGAWARGRRWRSTLAERTTHCCRADASVAPRTQRSLTRWEKTADYLAAPVVVKPDARHHPTRSTSTGDERVPLLWQQSRFEDQALQPPARVLRLRRRRGCREPGRRHLAVPRHVESTPESARAAHVAGWPRLAGARVARGVL